MSLSDLIEATAKLFKLITDNTTSVVLSVIGLLLLLVAILAILRGLKSDPPGWLKAVLFIALIFGIAFSIGGPSLAMLNFAENAIPKVSADKAFDNLETNAFAGWLIRLIPFDPAIEPHLAVSRLRKLGPDWHSFSFVAPYEEVRGLSATEAVRRVGGSLPDKHRLSAIIFQIPSTKNIVLYPANARGLLQVIREVEGDQTLNIGKPLLKGTGELDQKDDTELDRPEISTWRYENYKSAYPKYCALTHKFRCDRSPVKFSAGSHISDISDDWHPLGFSQKERRDPCTRPVKEFCTDLDWVAWKQSMLSKFGSRAFLLRNLDLDSLPKRYMIDFGEPRNQVIPDIGIR